MVRIELVRDIRQRMKEDNGYVKAVLKGRRKIHTTEKTIIVTPELFANIFSPQRINLLLELKRLQTRNIYQIAKELGRSYEAVHRDLKLLEGFGLITIKTEDRKRYPHLESIRVPMFEA